MKYKRFEREQDLIDFLDKTNWVKVVSISCPDHGVFTLFYREKELLE